ncbi:MAG: TonB-dependent receptor [Epsilonproteobacteria bacterium]|nr:TonB-dependent receptor [Campylobacterota bacterium]
MRKYFLTFLVFASFSSYAEEIDIDFMASLDEVSEIATKTKLNVDDTPSFVTVLRNEELQNLGVRNVFEALAFVPGVQLRKELSGVPVVIFRGVTQKGEVKLMVDGVVINNAYRASIYYYLDFPIELIDRIEVIRGAGSVLYGSNAISGVINIITKVSQDTTKKSLFISSGSYSYNKGGAVLSTMIDKMKFSIDGYYQKNNKTIEVSSNDSGYEGDSDRRFEDYSIGINLQGEDFSFNGRVKKDTQGNAYGVFGILDTDSDRFYHEDLSFFGELSYKKDIDKDNTLKVALGYIGYNQKVETALTDLKIINTDYKERNYFTEFNLLSKSLVDNQLLIGARFEYFDETQNDIAINDKELEKNPIIGSGFDRKISSVYFNDEYSFNPMTNISFGLRYDYYSDFKDSISPSFGIVYIMNDQVRLKALYSHSFRAPSWIELTSNSDLDAEKSDSIETGIVFKHSSMNIFKFNIYASKIEDMITKDPTLGKYIQDTKNNFYGVEFDYGYIPNNAMQLDFMASYIDAKDDDGNALPNVANFVASTTVTYQLDSGFVFGSFLRYISSSKRADTDPRGDMKESWIFDQTISYNYKSLCASLVVHDLFNEGVYYNISPNRYNEDYDDGGRTVTLNVSMEF